MANIDPGLTTSPASSNSNAHCVPVLPGGAFTHKYRVASLPMVFQPFGGFGDETVIENGLVRPPEAPGLGVETKSKLYNTVLKPLIDG